MFYLEKKEKKNEGSVSLGYLFPFPIDDQLRHFGIERFSYTFTHVFRYSSKSCLIIILVD